MIAHYRGLVCRGMSQDYNVFYNAVFGIQPVVVSGEREDFLAPFFSLQEPKINYSPVLISKNVAVMWG